jgi:hypothetical protein
MCIASVPGMCRRIVWHDFKESLYELSALLGGGYATQLPQVD